MSVRGWCPGLHDPMESGDGWLVRVRPPSARLTMAQAVVLDRLASECGNGIIEITSRGNLQVRGLVPATHAKFVDGVCGAGLGERDPVLERRRRVMAAPFADEVFVREVERVLMAMPALDGLPPKFVVRVDGGAVSIGDVPADAVVVRDGSAVRITAAARRPGGRVSGPIGRLPEVDAMAVAPRFGQFGPGELAALAMRAGGDLRVTPFRSVIASGVPDGFAEGLDLITEPGDPRLRIVACVGAPRCASGVGPARDVAGDYVRSLPPVGILHISGCSKACGFREGVFLVPGSGAAGPGGVQGRSPWP